jgi:uncharacterized membrane protein
MNAQKSTQTVGLARALGWFSVGLGVAQLAVPRRVSTAIGVAPHPLLMRAIGLRELTAGLGILSQARPAPWVGARVAGDAMDLGLLAVALASGGTSRARVAAATAAVTGIAALDVTCTRELIEEEGGLEVDQRLTVNRPAEALYRFWRDFENLPRVMSFIDSVQTRDPTHSHWTARTPLGHRVEWDAEVVEDRPDQKIAWRSLESSEVWHAGVVRFEPATGGRGTVVRLQMEYRTPLGGAGDIVARMFQGALREQVKQALRPFKQLMETGEITTTRGQPQGRTHPSLIRSLERAAGASLPGNGMGETSRASDRRNMEQRA